MAAPRFVHLRLHSEYSVTDGIVRIGDAVKRAVADGQAALALTDLGNLFGLVKFYQAARNAGLKPVLGADIWVTNESDPDRPYRLLLLCRNSVGYRQLCELLTRAYLADRRRGRAELRREWLADTGCDGLIALSAAAAGDVGEALASASTTLAAERAAAWAQLFPDAFYLEVQRAGQPGEETLVQRTADLAAEMSLPLVATHPVQFLEADDFTAHEVRTCIAEGWVLGDTRRPRQYTREQFFLSQDEMVARFSDLPEALENAVELARRCNVELTLGKNYLPDFPTPEGVSLEQHLRDEAQAGLERRLAQLFSDPDVRAARRTEYDERLLLELDTIIQMGFPGYFLIVADFINWAKHNGVPVGPGRGSGAGSLVAYSLGITDLDPLEYALLFERFLNPERVSMPDFDIDFCQDNRYRVIEYVRGKYGADAVSQIVTFGTMASKAVIRDVGRVLDLPYGLCDKLSKLVPVEQNKPLSLAKAREAEPQFSEMENDEQDGESVRELLRLAESLEGLTRNVGMHAGGVLIAPGKLTDFCPLYVADAQDAVPVSQFDKDDVEKAGLVKFDFLGLRNLTIIDLAVKYVRQLEGDCPDLLSLRFDDPAAYQILKDANTTAIFQVESEGMKKLLKKLGPDRFEDIIAVLALYRPGPLGSGMVDSFINRKKGLEKPDYFHPDLEACLEPTYGVIVYQEQVMQISQIIGGYTLGGADMLRRAMGKKKPEEMAKHREKIAAGAAEKGYDPALAEMLFDLMAKFAEYGFNKSHTAAYAMVTYQTAWLKAHHCAAFMAGTLSSDMDNTDTVKIFVDDARNNRLTVEPPDVNLGEYRFVPVDRQTIRYGLGAVKGVGAPAVADVLRARAEGPFADLFDFCRRVDRRQVNRRVIEALVRAGAFDRLDDHRARLLASVGIAMEAAEHAARHAGQCGLFDQPDVAAEVAPQLIEAPRWDERTRLAEEKLAIGFFLTGHPWLTVSQEIRRFVSTRLSRLQPGREPQKLAGIVVAMRSRMGARGKMYLVQLDDADGPPLEVVVYSEVYDRYRHAIRVDEPLIVIGKVREDRFNDGISVVADQLMTLPEARSEAARQLRLSIDATLAPDGAAARHLKALLAPFREGRCQVVLAYRNREGSCELPLGEAWRVGLEDDLIGQLRNWLGSTAVEVVY